MLTRCAAKSLPRFFRIDEVRHAETLTPFLLAAVHVDPDDHVSASKPQPLNDVEPDSAQAEYHAFGARLYLGGVEYRANSGRHATADVAYLVEGSICSNLGDRNLRQHGKIRKRGSSH